MPLPKWVSSCRWSFQAKSRFNQQVCVSVGWGLIKALTQPAWKALQAFGGRTHIGSLPHSPCALQSLLNYTPHFSLIAWSIQNRSACHSAPSLAVALMRTEEVFSKTTGDPQINTWGKEVGWRRREWRKEKTSYNSCCTLLASPCRNRQNTCLLSRSTPVHCASVLLHGGSHQSRRAQKDRGSQSPLPGWCRQNHSNRYEFLRHIHQYLQ